jgi:hypothetical protein
MLFFPNATIYVSDLKTIKNDEGTKIKTYDFENPLESFEVDVQPNTLTSAQIELYGISAKTANTKKCFTNLEDGKYMVSGNRAKVIYDDGAVEYYNIQPVTSWRFHKEFLLIPVENEK